MTPSATPPPAPGRPPLSPRRLLVNTGVSLLVAAGLGWFIWQRADTAELARVLRGVRWEWMVVALVTFLGYHAWRAERLRLLMDPPGERLRLLCTMCIQGLVNQVLPAGLGELALVWLLRRVHGVGAYRGMAFVIATRVVDALFFTLAFIVTVLLMADSLPAPFVHATLLLGGGILGGTGVVAVAAGRYGGRFLRERGDQGTRAGRWARRHLRELALELRALPGPRRLALLGAQTVIMWAVLCVTFLCIIRALGAGLSGLQVIALFILVFPASVLPIKGLGNVGTHETAWYLVLLLLGMSAQPAATLAFSSHILFFVIFLAAGGLGAAGALALSAGAPAPGVEQPAP